MQLWSRKSEGKGDQDSVITSHGTTVRFICGNVVLRDALHAIFPQVKRLSISYYFNLLAKHCPDLNIRSLTAKGKNGTEFTCDEETIKKIMSFMVLYKFDREDFRGRPICVDSRICPQVLEGFNRWGRRWFAPFAED